jgi:MFS transporter, ACS family, hexuronate transporter
VAANYRFLLLVVVNIGAIALFVGVITWTPAFLHDQRGMSLAAAAYLTAGIGMAQVLGSPFGAILMSRLGEGLVMAAGLFVMFVVTALVPFAPGIAGVFICVVISGFLTLSMFPALLRGVTNVMSSPEEVGAATGFMYTANVVGTILAPWLFGVLLDDYGRTEGDSGYVLGYLLLGLFAFLGLVAALLYLLARRSKTHAAVQSAVVEASER